LSLLKVDVGDYHLCAAPGKQFGDGLPDSLGGPGDDGDFVI
jgi:hypothetical protein